MDNCYHIYQSKICLFNYSINNLSICQLVFSLIYIYIYQMLLRKWQRSIHHSPNYLSPFQNDSWKCYIKRSFEMLKWALWKWSMGNNDWCTASMQPFQSMTLSTPVLLQQHSHLPAFLIHRYTQIHVFYEFSIWIQVSPTANPVIYPSSQKKDDGDKPPRYS